MERMVVVACPVYANKQRKILERTMGRRSE